MVHQPNILFLFPDQWRWDWLGVHAGAGTPYGEIPVQTPHLDRLAARGLRFTRCRTNSPCCAPARACLATGRRYEHCGVPHNAAGATPAQPPTLFQLLREAGYHTATCGKSDLFKADITDNPTGYLPIMDRLGFADGIDHRGKGDAVNIARGGGVEPYTQRLSELGLLDVHLADHPQAPLDRPARPTPLPDAAYTDDFAGANALALLERAPSDRPWMLWVNFPGPHDPFDPPAGMLDRYQGTDFPPPVNPTDAPPPHRHAAEDRRHYAACCTNIDAWVGRIIARLEADGQLEDTLIVFASDHGELLGDHGHWAKGRPEEGSVRVPLIAAGPGVSRGEVRDDLVELVDISASLLNAAGLPTPPHWAGQPLWGTADRTPREVQLSAFCGWRMICDDRYKLVLRDGGSRRLFDLRDDPAELRDVSDRHPDRVAALEAAYEREVAEKAGASANQCK